MRDISENIGFKMGIADEDTAPHNRVIHFLEAELLASPFRAKDLHRREED
jgi:hypothetical protein